MVFHEITEPAIRAAAENPRDLDSDLVDAQETRRILDRLYGYEVSPVLWKKVVPQAVGRPGAVGGHPDHRAARTRADGVPQRRLLGRRRRAGRQRVRPQATPPHVHGALGHVDGAAVATGRDFDSLGQLRKADEVLVLDEAQRDALAAALRGAQLDVASVEEKPYTRRPYAPFMTSTLQQEAGRKLRFSSERTMSIAQRLYENGYITYMRTDSTTLSESAINAARSAGPRALRRRIRLPDAAAVHPQGQERPGGARGHPARRGDVPHARGRCARELDSDEFRLYELIWQRTVASQMADARGTTVSVRITGDAPEPARSACSPLAGARSRSPAS